MNSTTQKPVKLHECISDLLEKYSDVTIDKDFALEKIRDEVPEELISGEMGSFLWQLVLKVSKSRKGRSLFDPDLPDMITVPIIEIDENGRKRHAVQLVPEKNITYEAYRDHLQLQYENTQATFKKLQKDAERGNKKFRLKGDRRFPTDSLAQFKAWFDNSEE